MFPKYFEEELIVQAWQSGFGWFIRGGKPVVSISGGAGQ